MTAEFANNYIKVPKDLREELAGGETVFVYLEYLSYNTIFLSKQPPQLKMKNGVVLSDSLVGETVVKSRKGIFLTQDVINRLSLKDGCLVEMRLRPMPDGNIVYVSLCKSDEKAHI